MFNNYVYMCRTCGYWSNKCKCDLKHRRWDLSQSKYIGKDDTTEKENQVYAHGEEYEGFLDV